MLDIFILGSLSVFSGAVLTLTGFGSAISMLSFWFVCVDFGLLTVVTSYIDIQVMITFMECCLATLLFLVHARGLQFRVVALILFVGFLGSVSGTLVLISFPGNPWIPRCLGVTFLLCWVVQMFSTAQSSTVRYYSLAKIRDFVGISVAYFLGGLVGGMSGTAGAPVIILVLINQYERIQVVGYNAVLYIIFNFTKLIFLIIGGQAKWSEAWVYFSVCLGCSIGVLVGYFISPYVSRAIFVDVLLCLLLCLGITCSSTEFPIENYTKYSPFIIFLALIGRYIFFPPAAKVPEDDGSKTPLMLTPRNKFGSL